MSGDGDEYKEPVDQASDTNTDSETVANGDSRAIASGIAERVTGDPDAFETQEEAVSKPSGSTEETKDQENGVTIDDKGAPPTPEDAEIAERAILKTELKASGLKKESEEKSSIPSGVVFFSGAALVIGGIVGALLQVLKRRSNHTDA